MYLPNRQNVNLQNLEFLLVVWAKALEATVSESGRQLQIPKLSAIEFILSWRLRHNFSRWAKPVTAKEFRSNMRWNKRFYKVQRFNYPNYNIYVKKKMFFFIFF